MHLIDVRFETPRKHLKRPRRATIMLLSVLPSLTARRPLGTKIPDVRLHSTVVYGLVDIPV
jgi:hypothetical protein